MTRSWRHVLCIKNSIDIDCNYFMQFGYFRSVSIGTVCGEGKELLCLRLVGTYQGLWLLKNSLSLRFLNWGTRIFPEFNIFCPMPCQPCTICPFDAEKQRECFISSQQIFLPPGFNKIQLLLLQQPICNNSTNMWPRNQRELQGLCF